MASRWGDWVLDERLATGGQAEVWRAHHARLRTSAAVKIVRPSNERARRRAAREMSLLRDLQHPNLVEVLDQGEADGALFLVMALADGGSLRDRLRVRPLTADEAATVLAGIADALAVVHRVGIVHRDVKPSNVLLDADGRPRLTDFGVAVRPDDDERVTATGEIVGSAGYLAPEVVRGAQPTPASDTWALGVVAYEALTGARPVVRDDGSVDADAIARDVRAAGADALANAIVECLAREPVARPAPEVVAQDVRRAYPNAVPVQPAPPEFRRNDAPSTGITSHGPRRAAYAGVAVVVAAALVAGVGVALARNDGGGGSSGRPPVVHTTTTTAPSMVFGVIQPQTGVDADFAATMRAPVRAAIRDINRAGGVNGDPVRAVFADDGSTNAGASVALRSMLAQHARVVLGPASSNIASAIMDELATAPVAACSGSTTSSTLVSAPDRGRFFRTVADDKMQAVALAQLVLADGHRNVALLSRSGEGFAAVAQIVSKVLTEGGARIVARPPDYIVQAEDFSEQTNAVAAAHPDAVVLVATEPDAHKLIPALDALGVGPNEVATYATDDLRGQTFARDVDPANPRIVAGLAGTLPASFVTAKAPAFVKALQSRGDDSVMAAYYYDCTMLAALAADEAGPGDRNGDALRQHFVDVSTGGTKCTTYARCVALLRDGTDIDYDGLTGPVDLDAAGNVRSARFKVWRYRDDGTLVGVDRPPIAVDQSAVPAL